MLHLKNQLKSYLNNTLTKARLFPTFSTKKQGQQRNQKVFIDEQAIKRKMKEIKQKGQYSGQKQKTKRLKNPEFMPTFTIPQVNKKVNDFRKQTNTENLFSFSDITLEQKPTVLQITGYDPQFFQIDNFPYPPSIILTPNQVLNWQVQNTQSIRIQHFSLLKLIKPIPEYVIVGVPDSTVISVELKNNIKKLHHNVDILDIFEAISQFNTVANADRFIIAFLMNN